MNSIAVALSNIFIQTVSRFIVRLLQTCLLGVSRGSPGCTSSHGKSKYGAASQAWIWTTPDILTHSSRHVEGQFFASTLFVSSLARCSVHSVQCVQKCFPTQGRSIFPPRNLQQSRAAPNAGFTSSCSSLEPVLIPDNAGCRESRACINLPDSSICLGSAAQGWDFISIIPVFCASLPPSLPARLHIARTLVRLVAACCFSLTPDSLRLFACTWFNLLVMGSTNLFSSLFYACRHEIDNFGAILDYLII